MRNLRIVAAPVVPLLGSVLVVAGCSSSSGGTPAATSIAAAQGPGGGAGGPGGGGGMQTFTAVDLDTAGTNASGANTSEVVTAANAFLATLDTSLKSKIVYDFGNNQARQTWSNFPVSFVQREGVALSDLSAPQKTAALNLVSTMLSADGYSQVKAVQAADDYLKSLGDQATMGTETYHIAVYGTPSTSAAFMIQFGGHHLARNYTYKGTTASITPDFTGTEPKSFTSAGSTVEPMKQKASTMFAVFDSLTADEKSKAKLSAGTVDDILMGPGMDSGTFPTSEGVLGSQLTAAQQQTVLKAIAAWVDDAAPAEAASLMSAYTAQLDQTRISWAGSTTVDGENTYLRIDGPRVWIELINTRSQSTPNVHYHGVYRDKTDDYGSTNPSS